MKNADKSAYPIEAHRLYTGKGVICCEGEAGLTKRERFAMAAMQGLLGMKNLNLTFKGSELNREGVPTAAVRLADALLKELED